MERNGGNGRVDGFVNVQFIALAKLINFDIGMVALLIEDQILVKIRKAFS